MHAVRSLLALALLATLAVLTGCAADDPNGEISLSLRADVAAPETEVYECYYFDASVLAGKYLKGLHWTTDPNSPVLLHHAGVFAVPDVPGPGPIPCESLPSGAAGLHVWAPGSSPMALPDGIAMKLPESMHGIMVQAHVLRVREGAPSVSTLTLETTTEAPAHVATWLRASAPVPAIAAHSSASSTGSCRVAGDIHVLTARPHMHRIGVEFHSEVVHLGGAREPFADVDPWVWNDQSTFDEHVVLRGGDAIETTCVWDNTTSSDVKDGLKITDEMCQQGMIVWPAEHAFWETCP